MKRDVFERTASAIQSSTKTLLIEGARQVGKSYLVNQILNEIDIPFLRFDLEKDDRTRNLINRTQDFTGFRELMEDRFGLRSGSILFIDEAQECSQLARYVKSFSEDWPDIKVVLTGSSMNRFFPKDMRIPVGRTQSLCIYPFSFAEFVRFTQSQDLAGFLHSVPKEISPTRHEFLLELFDIYLNVGGYPEAVKAYAAEESYTDAIAEIAATLSEDFMRKEEYKPLQFDLALAAISNNVGFPSKYTHFDTTKYHAKKLIEALRSWHVVIEVEQHPLNPISGKYLPKRYLCDIGLLNLNRSTVVPRISLLHTVDGQLRCSLGGLFENAVVLNLLEGQGAHKKIHTWKKNAQSSVEIDFVVESSDERGTIPIECKAATRLSRKHCSGVIEYLTHTHQKKGVVVSCVPFQELELQGVTIVNVPVYLATRANILQYCS